MVFFSKSVSLSPSRVKEALRGNSAPKSRGRNRSQSEDIRAAIAREKNVESYHHPNEASELHRHLDEDKEELPHSTVDLDNPDKTPKNSPKTRYHTRSLSRSRRNAATRPLHNW